MARFKVVVGGEVTKVKLRTFVVSAEDEDEARKKADDEFWSSYLSRGYDILGATRVESVERLVDDGGL